MIKKFFILLGFVFFFGLGVAVTPHPSMIYDPVAVTGLDYGFDDGTYIMKKEKIRIKRVFTPDHLFLIQEPDGTIHLVTKKSGDAAMSCILRKQADRFYPFMAKWYSLYQRIILLRKQLMAKISLSFVSPCIRDSAISHKEII